MRTMVNLLSFSAVMSSRCAPARGAAIPSCMHAAGGPLAAPAVEPPATITFDDVEFTRLNPTVYSGTLKYVHTSSCDCLATEKEERWLHREEVRSPCVIECHEVFAEIPAYRQIRQRSLGEGDADYWLLLSQANMVFRAAVAATIRELKLYDVVLGHGSLRLRDGSKARGIPDITHEVIKRLKP